jgi:hypothetical protein
MTVKKPILSIVLFLWLMPTVNAACSTSVPAGSIQVVDCNQENVVANSPYFSLSDATGLPLGFWFAWNNAGTTLASGVPVSGQLAFASGNPVISWPGNGLTTGSYMVLTTGLPNYSTTGTLPSNFTASTLTTQTVYYVIATGLTANTLELSATPGGAAVTPSGNSVGTVYGLNLVAGFSAWANSVFNTVKIEQQQAATAAPTPPVQLVITPAQ